MLLRERPLWPELTTVPSFPACGLRRWRFPRTQAEAAAAPTPLQGPAVGLLPKLPAPPLLLPGQVAALWSPGPNFLLPASSHLWEAPLGCPANFQRLLPQEAISAFPPPPTPGLLPLLGTHQFLSLQPHTQRITWTISPFSIWFLAEHWVPLARLRVPFPRAVITLCASLSPHSALQGGAQSQSCPCSKN